jgi:hypothetical protein
LTSRPALHLPSLTDLEAARERLTTLAVRTPLIRLSRPAARSPLPELWLKLENLQPIVRSKSGARGTPCGSCLRRRCEGRVHSERRKHGAGWRGALASWACRAA